MSGGVIAKAPLGVALSSELAFVVAAAIAWASGARNKKSRERMFDGVSA
jgi:hypothetical protein